MLWLLTPFYKQNIMNQFTPKDTEPPYFVLCFDEAFSIVSNQKHFVRHLIYFDEYLQGKHRLYFNSQFMGHAQASHLIHSLIEVLKDLDYVNKMIQVFMDWPIVNWFLLDKLSSHQKEENANGPDLMNIGSCVLHIVHGSFGTALRKMD